MITQEMDISQHLLSENRSTTDQTSIVCDEDDNVFSPLMENSPRILPDIKDITTEVLGIPDEFSFKIDDKYLPDVFIKKQRRVKGNPSKQWLDGGEAKLTLLFSSKEVFTYVQEVTVGVKNILVEDINQAEEIIVHAQPLEPLTYVLEFNLNSVISNEVYALVRTSSEKKKQFHLIVTVLYETGDKVAMPTKTFTIRGTPKKRSTSSDQSEEGSDRKKSNSFDSNTPEDFESIDNCDVHSPLISPTSPVVKAKKKDRSVEVKRLVADHIRTKVLEIDGATVSQQMTSQNGDIAYHFYLDDQDELFEEGQVVGFVPSTKDRDRKCVIVKLNFETASKAILKGVVTRSQFFEAKCPSKKDKRRTETICMMGIIPVKVVGSVSASEFLYASPNHPGYAISGFHLDYKEKRNAAAIGVAFTSRKTDDETSFGMVEAGVSVMQFASQFLVNERLRNIEEGFDCKIHVDKKTGKHWKRGLCIGFGVLFILSLLLAIYLWQLLTPGSALRYYRCELGRKLPYATSTYAYNVQPYPDNITIDGIEFDFTTLVKKLSLENYPPLRFDNLDNKVVGARYFLNLHRCANIFMSTKMKQIPNPVPDMFAVDRYCSHVYVYNEDLSRWRIDDVTSVLKHYLNIICNPPVKRPP